jgi:hypothetical protein
VQDLGVDVQRRRTVEVGDGVDTGCARAPGSHGSTRGGAASVLQGLERSGNCRWCGIAGAELLTSGNVLEEISAHARWRPRRAGLGSILGMRRGLCGGSGGT